MGLWCTVLVLAVPVSPHHKFKPATGVCGLGESSSGNSTFDLVHSLCVMVVTTVRHDAHVLTSTTRREREPKARFEPSSIPLGSTESQWIRSVPVLDSSSTRQRFTEPCRYRSSPTSGQCQRHNIKIKHVFSYPPIKFRLFSCFKLNFNYYACTLCIFFFP